MLATLEESGFFSADQIEVLRLKKPILLTTQFSPPLPPTAFGSCRNSRIRRRRRPSGTSIRCSHRRQMTTPSSTNRLSSQPRLSPAGGSHLRERWQRLRYSSKLPPRSAKPARSSMPIDLSVAQRASEEPQKLVLRRTAQGKCHRGRKPRRRRVVTSQTTSLLRHPEHASHNLRDPACQTPRIAMGREQPSTLPKARKLPALLALRRKARGGKRHRQEKTWAIPLRAKGRRLIQEKKRRRSQQSPQPQSGPEGR